MHFHDILFFDGKQDNKNAIFLKHVNKLLCYILAHTSKSKILLCIHINYVCLKENCIYVPGKFAIAEIFLWWYMIEHAIPLYSWVIFYIVNYIHQKIHENKLQTKIGCLYSVRYKMDYKMPIRWKIFVSYRVLFLIRRKMLIRH